MGRKVGLCLLAGSLALGCQPLVEDIPDVNPVGGVVSPPLPPPPPPGETDPPAPRRTPTPSETETPTPKPTPTSSGGGGGGGGAICATSCKRTGGAFMADYNTAKDKAVKQNPGYFNNGVIKSGKLNGKSYRDLFTQAVASNMSSMGYSASLDPNDFSEIRVKTSGTAKCTGFSEQYQPLISNGTVRPCPDCYRATCTPAWF